jgi:DNA-binding transcriptional MerR regulator
VASPKAPDAFRTISEVADDLDLPQHVLRFWETRFAQIKPMKRGGGRRYYRPEDVDLLRGIRLLLYGEGFTIRGVQRLLKEKGVGFVVEVGQTGSVETVTAAEGDRAQSASPPPRVREAREAPVISPPLRIRPVEEPVAAPPPPRRTVFALSQDKRRRLQAALDDLEEAKRLLEEAR